MSRHKEQRMMLYRKVPRIEENISQMAIGCWNMGGDWDSSDNATSIHIIHEAIERGINFFDVAPVYGWGHSEMLLGEALKDGGRRRKVLIATKAGILWQKAHGATAFNLSKQSLLREIDGLCRHLPDALAGPPYTP
jgi:aryl-alcohol dehydrogenase-like predicted oxidoreductase